MFDPSLPQPNTPLQSQIIRDQLNSLKDLIDAILTISAAQVDTVNTLNPGDPATASLLVAGNTLHFTFGIPRGNDGSQGIQGPQGNDGGTGPQGPPFASAIVDGVTTLSAGQPATVSVTFDGTNVHFQFGIPQGNDGAQGPNGSDGAQGPPGEVTSGQLNSAIQGTSNNMNAVASLGLVVSDPPTQSEVQQMANKLDELMNALRR